MPPGSRLDLRGDPEQADRDSYGRLLRYAEHDGVDVQEVLLQAGAVRARTSTLPVDRQTRYAHAAATAQKKPAGPWNVCAN